jgi:hypothetical protein
MIATRSLLRIGRAVAAIAFVATAGIANVSAAGGTRYFAVIPGANVPVAIGAFSSDARADVADFSSGTTTDARPAHGKFSVVAAISPFTAGQSLDTLIVLAQTPQKLVTFTFSGVTIDGADPTSGKNERITFEAANYSVKFTDQKPASGQSQP